MCGLLGSLKLDQRPTFTEGQTVRVVKSVNLKHVPKHKEGYDAKGLTGTVARVYSEPELSPTLDIVVAFTEPAKFRAHFEPTELEAV